MRKIPNDQNNILANIITVYNWLKHLDSANPKLHLICNVSELGFVLSKDKTNQGIWKTKYGYTNEGFGLTNNCLHALTLFYYDLKNEVDRFYPYLSEKQIKVIESCQRDPLDSDVVRICSGGAVLEDQLKEWFSDNYL